MALTAIVDFTRHLQVHGFVDGRLDVAGLVQRIGALETLKAVAHPDRTRVPQSTPSGAPLRPVGAGHLSASRTA
ncbi:MAG: hypothetical protein ABIR83_07440 [Nakamurella sp.]